MISTRCSYFVDYSTRMTTWDDSDPRLPLAVDANAPQYKREYRQKVVYFRGQLPIYSMRPIADAKGEVRLRRSWVFENNPMTYASGLWSRLKVRMLPIMVVNAANGLSHHPKKVVQPELWPLQARPCYFTPSVPRCVFRSGLLQDGSWQEEHKRYRLRTLQFKGLFWMLCAVNNAAEIELD